MSEAETLRRIFLRGVAERPRKEGQARRYWPQRFDVLSHDEVLARIRLVEEAPSAGVEASLTSPVERRQG